MQERAEEDQKRRKEAEDEVAEMRRAFEGHTARLTKAEAGLAEARRLAEFRAAEVEAAAAERVSHVEDAMSSMQDHLRQLEDDLQNARDAVKVRPQCTCVGHTDALAFPPMPPTQTLRSVVLLCLNFPISLFFHRRGEKPQADPSSGSTCFLSACSSHLCYSPLCPSCRREWVGR